jgi:hypothetical protein
MDPDEAQELARAAALKLAESRKSNASGRG